MIMIGQLPEPTPKPALQKIGIIFLSPEDMQEAKKSMKEKGIKAEDVKNLSPIEEIHGLDNPTQVVEVNSLYRFDEGDIPHYKSASQCLQENFNAYVGIQLKHNADMLEHLSDYMSRVKGELKLISKMLLWLTLK